MLRAGRFKHRLLDDIFLKQKSPLAAQFVSAVLPFWQSQEIADQDMVTLYLLIFLSLRRPGDFLSGKSALQRDLSTSSNPKPNFQNGNWFFERFAFLRNHTELKGLAVFDRPVPLVELAYKWNFRSIPFSVNRSLYSWAQGHYKLKLMTGIPSASEVLTMQTQATRCLSMLVQPQQMQNFVEEGRDVLGFLIHDLIHADHFFHDPEKARGQILFSQKLSRLYHNPTFQEWLQKDTSFAKEFTYLMSDMNSVPLHLIKTLKAICLGSYKRQKQLPLNTSLNRVQEKEFSELFCWVLHPWELSAEDLKIFDKINTLRFNWETHALPIHELLMKEGSQPSPQAL